MPHSDDGRTAHQAGGSGTAVDVDLSTMPVLPWGTSGKDRIVLWPHSIDPASSHALAHELDEIHPHRRPLIGMHRAARLQRIQLMPKQHLSAIDVTNPDQY